MNTEYFVNCVAGNVFGTKKTPALPTTYYLGLSTTTPKSDGTGYTEPSAAAGYNRLKLENLTSPEDGLVVNEKDLDFDESTANWGMITHFIITDSATRGAGNLLIYGELTTPRSVEKETIMTFKEESLSLFTPMEPCTCDEEDNS